MTDARTVTVRRVFDPKTYTLVNEIVVTQEKVSTVVAEDASDNTPAPAVADESAPKPRRRRKKKSA